MGLFAARTGATIPAPMRVKVELLAGAVASAGALSRAIEWAETFQFAYAWMGGAPLATPWRFMDHAKVSRGVIGLHFAGTEPRVLELFLARSPKAVAVVTDPVGTFHPKILLASRGDERQAIIGSSNFTEGGFSRNSEVNVLVTGGEGDAFFQELEMQLGAYWMRAVPITKKLLKEYEEAWRKRPRPKEFRRPAPELRTPVVATLSDLDVTWDGYVALLRKQVHRNPELVLDPSAEDTYLSEMRIAQRAFRSRARFADLEYEQRRAVAGFGPRIGWYGATRAAGVFMNLVKEQPKAIGSIIDRVPLEGPVDDSVVLAAFASAARLERVGIACVTRLLCMKRPDLFVSINAKMRDRMREKLGSVPSTPEEYLSLLPRIRRMPWYTAPRPADRFEREIWHARVALLDAVFYDPL